MSEALIAGWAAGYAALLVWLVVRVVNRPKSWGMAIALPVLVGCIGGVVVLMLAQVLRMWP